MTRFLMRHGLSVVYQNSAQAMSKGTIYLSNIRYGLCCSQDPLQISMRFLSMEIRFNQPKFLCNNIAGFVGNSYRIIVNKAFNYLITTYFDRKLFFLVLKLQVVPRGMRLGNSTPHTHSRFCYKEGGCANTPVVELIRHAYVDPNDLTRIFLKQPTPQSELRRRTYQPLSSLNRTM
ncbi:hypothetical protein NC651_000019 [Populus alba x Populus x berolinensis]|nr:hypothetical protein NC651_000019 [Populus alba x Populus x berolinensis]